MATVVEVERIADLALRCLESKSGRRHLAGVGDQALKDWDEDRANRKKGAGPIKFDGYGCTMDQCVDFFLEKMQAQFPHIRLTNTIGRESLADPTARRPWGRKLNDWDPKAVATIYLNQTVSPT